MKTETIAPTTSVSYAEPTHDEIALAAFLAWERDGRQPGREMQYWLEAETQIRTARQKKAEATATQPPVTWPRPSRAAQVKEAAVSVAQKLTTAVTRGTAPKSSTVKKTTTKKSSARTA